MCGIVGVISDREIERARFRKMLYIVSHRGPDDEGMEHFELARKWVSLGHKRLSIIDLSIAGRQPMTNEDGTIWIISNGEIYNYKNLKQRLGKHKFYSNTDTEVLIHLYEERGIGMLKDLNGMFGFALLDLRKSQVYICRDRLGIKPLYYFKSEKGFIFASEIKSILAFGVQRKLNYKALNQFFHLNYIPGNETLLKGIQRLPPGNYIKFDLKSNQSSINKYWDLTPASDYLRIEEAQHEIHNILKDSVEKRLIADVPVGTLLSGGLDSSILAYLIRDRKSISHYCIRKRRADLLEEGVSDDFHYANSLSDRYHLNLTPIEVNPDLLTERMIKKVIWYQDDIIADPALIPTYLITKQAKATSTVLLSGMGADELFFGYQWHVMLKIAAMVGSYPLMKQGIKVMSTIANQIPENRGKLKRFRRYLGQMFRGMQYHDNRRIIEYELFSRATRVKKVLNNKYVSPISDDLNDQFSDENTGFYDQIFIYDVKNFLVKNLQYTDRMSMANSTEIRVPFLDHRLVELAAKINPTDKIKGFLGIKYILKDTFKEALPKEIINRRKSGFGLPVRSWFKDRENIKKLLRKDLLERIGILKPDGVKGVIKNHLSGYQENSALLWAIITFLYWYEIYIEKFEEYCESF